MSKEYTYTDDWFSHNIPMWDKLFNQHINVNKHVINDVLEIGCYEGKASVYMAEKWLQEGTNYDVVDTFGGSAVESGMQRHVDKLKENEDFIYHNFVNNISNHQEVKWNIHRGISQVALPILFGEGKMYDFIYIDASHQSDDTFVDAYYAHKMLKGGGVLIFDDFGWKDIENDHVNHSPAFGISAFVELYSDYYNLLFQGYQIGLYRKTQKEYEDDMLKKKWVGNNVPSMKKINEEPITIKGTFG